MQGAVFQSSQGFGCTSGYGKAVGMEVRWPWVPVSALLLPYHCADLVGHSISQKSQHLCA